MVALVTWLITVASFCNILLNPEEVKMGVLTHKNRKKRWSLFNRRESQDKQGMPRGGSDHLEE